MKPDANIVCEFVFDVNTAWFEENGGYEYAKRFFTDAYRMAVKEVGDERYILSAVMHADERNKALSEELGRDVYHYHLHVVYVPVVEKQIRWSKRCKDEHLRGTVRETIHQVSCSKKWAFQNAVDEQGNPVLGKSGQQVRIPSYRPLQDRFFDHMREAGYDTLQRGERGNDIQHLSTLDYKVQQEQERLEKVSEQIVMKEQKLDQLSDKLKTEKQTMMTFGELESAGRRTLLGKRELDEKDFSHIVGLAKEGIKSRSKIHDLSQKLHEANASIRSLKQSYDKLYEQTRDFIRAVKIAPQRVKAFIDELIHKERKEPNQQIQKMKQKER